MHEIIALIAPALVALGFYNHLKRDKLPTRKLFTSFGLFLVLVNLCMYLVIIYIFNHEHVIFSDKSFINYLIGASLFAFVLPFVVNLVEGMVAIEVKKNDKK